MAGRLRRIQQQSSQIDGVVKYILNQKEHHRKKNFKEEYLGILNDYGIEYDTKYIFHDLLDD